MRRIRRCPFRLLIRPRIAFWSLIISLASGYFVAVSVFQSGLSRSQLHRPGPLQRRTDAERADDNLALQQHQRVLGDLIDGHTPPPIMSYDAQRTDRLLARGLANRSDQPSPLGKLAPNVGPLNSLVDFNVPASCDSSDIDRRRRIGFLSLANVHLLSAFWDQRPNDFDNQQNGMISVTENYIALVTIASTSSLLSVTQHFA